MKYIIQILIIFSILTSFCQDISSHVFFKVDDFSLNSESKIKLDSVLLVMKNSEIEIIGYTDSTGSEAYNLQLSKKRAQSVANYLTSKGFDRDKIKATLAKGETTSATELSGNRKVSIIEIKSNNNESHLSKTKDAVLNQTTIDSIEVGDILNIGGLEFHGGRHYLKKYSMPVLEELTSILKDNPNVKIEIQGHICCQQKGDGLDTDTGTYNLSENRAEMIYNKLIKRGISEDRLSHKGFGSSRKLSKTEDTPTAMQKNRRVSILIIEK